MSKEDNYWEGISLPKKDKRILYFIFGIPVLCLIIFIIIGLLDKTSLAESFLSSESKIYFKGKVASEYRQKDNHNVKVAVLNDGYEYQIMAEWEKLIDVGDSISKKKDSLYIHVVKPDGKRLKLDYVEAVKKWRN